MPELTADDRLLVDAFAARDVDAAPVVWDRPDVDWRRYDAVVVRSCWDYHHRLDAFLAWIDAVDKAAVPLWNPPSVLRWNVRKTYLQQLAARGVRTVPTRWVGPHDDVTLASVLDATGWSNAVVKPTVSASAHNTWRTSRAEAPAHESRFRALAGAMVQPFVPEVVTPGEWSLVFIDGTFSHAVLKTPRADDFRVQSEHGGTATAVAPPRALIEDAAAALSAAGTRVVYARVDGCAVDGRLMLMELELVEPQLYLTASPDAAHRLAAAILPRAYAA